MARLSRMLLSGVAALALVTGCATTRAVTLAPDEPVAAWGAGEGQTNVDRAPGSRLEPENQPPPGGWSSLWAPAAQPVAVHLTTAVLHALHHVKL